jgi:hypothetical protein
MSDAKTVCKDLGLGLLIGAVLGVVAIRCIELYSRPDAEAADVPAIKRFSVGQTITPCESRELAF